MKTEDGNVLAWGRAAALAGLEGRWLSPHLLTLPIRVVQLALGVFHALIVAREPPFFLRDSSFFSSPCSLL